MNDSIIPATPTVPAPTVTAHVEPTTQADLTPTEVAKLAAWAKADLLAGKITQAQADKQFAELNTPLDQRGLDTRSDEAKELDKHFPQAKPTDYRIAYGEPGQEPAMTPELRQFDQNARTWMSTAGMPKEIGNSLVNQIGKVMQATEHMTPDQLDDYGHKEFEKLQRVHGGKLEERLQAAAVMIDQLERTQPGLKNLLRSKGIGDSAIVANLLISHSAIYHARRG